jgi:Tc5 transposase DNA-binding domain
MVRRLDPAAAERESKLELALAGLADGTYTSIDHAVSVLRVPKTTLFRRVHGGKTRNEAAEWRQLLTKHEEKALAQWISTSTVSGHPVRHSVIHNTENLRWKRVSQHSRFVPPIAPTWVPAFLRRHPHLKTKLSRAIEVARVTDVTAESVIHFNQELRRIIRDHNIKLENTFNMDETGTSFSIIINSRLWNWDTANSKCCRRYNHGENI